MQGSRYYNIYDFADKGLNTYWVPKLAIITAMHIDLELLVPEAQFLVGIPLTWFTKMISVRMGVLLHAFYSYSVQFYGRYGDKSIAQTKSFVHTKSSSIVRHRLGQKSLVSHDVAYVFFACSLCTPAQASSSSRRLQTDRRRTFGRLAIVYKMLLVTWERYYGPISPMYLAWRPGGDVGTSDIASTTPCTPTGLH